MISFKLYLLFVLLPNFGLLCAIICALSLILSIFVLVDSKKEDRKYGIFLFSVFVISGFITFLVPTQKEIAIIYLAPKIMNNQVIQQIPAEIMKFIDKQIASDDK
jgi:TctA family transporter